MANGESRRRLVVHHHSKAVREGCRRRGIDFVRRCGALSQVVYSVLYEITGIPQSMYDLLFPHINSECTR